ncbi:lipid-binding protein [Nonlabens spongiae]|uniref:Lipid-binding protein n=1 Tax=Nonlabens spongiae TaxID=331648 RepID=A0A1W6MG80_9FLAO|nr:YceI family protein [Nonlabens spongiae]ARN76582.1 lipid-binding protein [Nonlabens spongiae]
MNKNFLKVTGLAAMIAFTAACKDAENEVEAKEEAEVAEATMEAVTYNVDTQNSKIAWVGSKVAGEHTGNIMLKDGMVKVNGEELESGEFTVDMTSIEVTDLEGESATNLKAHLEGTVEGKETDFFNTPKYPTAKFVVTGVESKEGKTMLMGNLTLKDVTKNVAFPVMVSYEGNKMMLKSEPFEIDRTDWGIKYGSSNFTDVVKDKAIDDDIQLTVDLVATK